MHYLLLKPVNHIFMYFDYVYDLQIHQCNRYHSCFYFESLFHNLLHTGTTWTQEIVYLLMNGGDVEEARSRDINDRFPFMEWQTPGEVSCVDKLAAEPGQRLIKSHLGPHFFEKALKETKGKFIICMRNVKDNLVSYYHFYKTLGILGDSQGSFSEYLKLFEQKKLVHGDWFDFNLAWWALKDNPNILFATFEELSQDLEGEVRRIDAFLGKNSSDDVINKVCENVTFDVMKKNPTVNRSKRMSNFMRKGKVGDWRSHFSMEESVALDELYGKKMKDSGLTFQFDSSFSNGESTWEIRCSMESVF